MSDTPNLDELIREVEALLRLLKAREVGLFTWQTLVRERMRDVWKLLGEYVGEAGKPPHLHQWYEYDGSYYCYGCKTFMPDKGARDAFVAEGR